MKEKSYLGKQFWAWVMHFAVWSSFLEEHTPTENEQETHLAREERSHASLLYPATSSHHRVAFLHRLRVTPVIPVSRRRGSWAVHTPRTVLTRASLGWAWAAGSSGHTWLAAAFSGCITSEGCCSWRLISIQTHFCNLWLDRVIYSTLRIIFCLEHTLLLEEIAKFIQTYQRAKQAWVI